MSKTLRLSIPFTSYTVAKCMCVKCPVQAKSTCAKENLSNMGVTVCGTKPLQREEIPGVYCSTGFASCKDIDPKGSCICGTCSIFTEYKLGTAESIGYYCTNGTAY